jgi:hypothetical protein
VVQLRSGGGLQVVRALLHEGLGQQHPRDADEGDDDQEALDQPLPAVDVRVAAGLGGVGPEEDLGSIL